MTLSPEFKLAWLYICDKCDCAGVIEINEPLANLCIGTTVNWTEFLNVCDTRLLSLAKGRQWIVKFVEFQQPGGLSTDSNVHFPILKSLSKYNLIDRLPEGYVKGSRSLVDALAKAPGKGTGNSNSKSNGKSNPRKTKLQLDSDFQKWYSEYPKKKAPDAAKKAYEAVVAEMVKSGSTSDDACSTLLVSLKAQLPELNERFEYCPHPASWLRSGCYKNEIDKPIDRVPTAEDMASWRPE